MKHILLLTAFVSLVFASGAQTWNFVGSSVGYNASEVDIEITPNGQLYMAYIDTDNGSKATVRKWVNNAWQIVGTAGISSTNCFDIQLVVCGEDNPAVAMKHVTTISATNYEFIEIYRWSGAAWVSQSTGGYPWTYHSKPYSLRANTTGTLFLTFFNRDYQTHDEGVITVNLSNQTQIGTIANDWDEDNYAISSYVGAGNDVRVGICELADMDYSTDFKTFSGGSWNFQNLSYGEEATKLKLEKGYATTNHCAMWQTVSPTALRFRGIGAASEGTPLTITSSSSTTDFDFDTQADNAFVFYRNGTTCYFKQITGTMSPVQSTITSGTSLAPSNAISLAAETYFGVHVIAYVSSGKALVKEYNQAANIEDYDLFQMCEGTYFNNNGDMAVYCLDPNFMHSNMSMTCVSQNTAIIPQSSINVTTSDYLSWYLTISTTNDVATTTTIDLLWTLFEDGVQVGTIYTPVTIYPNPTIGFNFGQTTFCENEGVVNLNGKATPPNGNWSGTGVLANFFYAGANAFNPSPTATSYLVYSKTTAQGCTSEDSILVTINQVPELSLTIDDADCGQTNGSASVAISGGDAPYDTYWSNGSTFTSVTDLAPGPYYVNVTDNSGCSATAAAPIGSSGISLTAATNNVQCYGALTGGINLTVTGNNGPFTYAWSNGATTQDINNLAAGPYEVEVTDDEGCVSTATYTILQPAQLNLSGTNVTSPSCGNTNGSVTVSFTGGSSPFTYAWEDENGNDLGVSSATITNVGAGYLTAIVTDNFGCESEFPVLVSNANGPTIAIDTIITSSCNNDGAIELTNVSNNAQNFLWSNGATTQNIAGVGPGLYIVEASSANGCTTVLSAEVTSTLPIAVEVCLVTVDTLTNTNLVVWEKPVTNDIASFNIYRETSQVGLYQLVGNVPYADESIYNDLVASPSVRSWRYKISSVDACGVESDISLHHKTIHLVINLGLGSDINLSWDSYEGFAFPEFVIKRYTDADGWNTITTMPTNLFTYTDTPPTTDGLVYLVTVDPPATCTSTKSLAQDFNSARSNKDNRFKTADASLDELLAANTNVFPNPSNGTVTLENNNSQTISATIYDASGRLLYTLEVPYGQTQADLSFLADGMYQLVFTAKEARASRKLTIAH